MKTLQIAVIAFAAMLGATSAQAQEAEPGEKIEVACSAGGVRMAAIDSAVQNSHYWAPETARRRMLSLARYACSLGATVVTFVPPPGRHSCRTPPTWSTLCVDQSAMVREVVTSSIPSSFSAQQ